MPSSDEARPPSRRLRVSKASDLLADELRAEILEKDMQPGTPFPTESELIEKHQFSRGTVREALRLLEVEGFIDIRRGRFGGIQVQHPSVDLVSRSLATLLVLSDATLGELIDFRKLVEPAGAAAAAREATADQRQAIRDIAARRSAAVAFHDAVGECANNEFLRIFLAAINTVIEWRTNVEETTGGTVPDVHEEHVRIAEAIAEGDADRAADLMLHHIDVAEQELRRNGRLEQPVVARDRWVQHLRRRQGTGLGT